MFGALKYNNLDVGEYIWSLDFAAQQLVQRPKSKGDYSLDISTSHVASSTKVGNFCGFSTLELNNMTLVFLPPNVSTIIQPLDQGIIASLKIQYKNKLLQWV
jgi:hypothetical protein